MLIIISAINSGSSVSLANRAKIGPYIWIDKKSSYLHFAAYYFSNCFIDSDVIVNGSDAYLKHPLSL